MSEKILIVAGGGEATELLSNDAVELVVMAIKLPEDSGLQTLPRFLEAKKNLKVVINTDYLTCKMDFHARSADAFLVRASDLTRLKETIDVLFHKPA